MANKIFNALIEEKTIAFLDGFNNISKHVFTSKEGVLIHPGEYGTYRERLCAQILKSFLPRNLEISTGFLINSNDEISSQCDIVIYDSSITPLLKSTEDQRFFPVESVIAIGEIKSILSKTEFCTALNKLSKAKSLKDRIQNPHILNPEHHRIMPVLNGGNIVKNFNPQLFTEDNIYTFLICEKIDFEFELSDFDFFYDNDVEYRHRHNAIVSLEDGYFNYYDEEKNIGDIYPIISDKKLLNSKIIKDDKDDISFFKIFLHDIFLGMSRATILQCDVVNYVSIPDNAKAANQKNYLDIKEAKKIIKILGFKRKTQFEKWAISDERPDNIPKYPDKYYRHKGWESWPKFLQN